jgi:hypothetical protein
LTKYDTPLATIIITRITNAGHAVGLEPVGARTDRVARVVARAVRDHPGVARVVFLDVEDDLHQVGPDVGDFREDAAGNPQRRRAERFADREADEARAGVLAGDEQQDAQHDQQLDADQQHADAHAGAQRDRVDRERHPAQARERGARVGEGIHPDAEPRDTVAAADPDEREQQDDRQRRRDRLPWNRVEPPVVGRDDCRDERPEDQDEPPLGDEVGLTCLVDQLRHLAHRLMDRQVPQAGERRQAEQQPERTDQQTAEQQRAAVDPAELDHRQIGNDQVGLAARVNRQPLPRFRARRFRRLSPNRRRRHTRQQHQDGNPSGHLPQHNVHLAS